MNKFVIRVAKIGSLLFALLIVAFAMQKYVFVHMDGNKIRMDGFYLEDKNTVDVVFFGASEVFAGFSAGQAYEEFGFTSYPFVVDSNSITMLKSQIKEVYNYQKPKLLVIEINGALYDDDSKIVEEAGVRRYTDNMPYSVNKYKTIMNGVAAEEKGSYLFPLIKYHGNWQDYRGCISNANDIVAMEKRGYSLLKGAFTYTTVDKNVDVADMETLNGKLELTKKSEMYLRDVLQYLQDENITNVLFVRFPHKNPSNDSYFTDRAMRGNRAGEIIEEYGFEYINFERNIADTGLDYNKHFYNEDHLNVYGQQIFTSYLSRLIVEKYGIEKANLTTEQQKQWNESVRYTNLYYQYAERCIKEGREEWISENCALLEKLEKIE